MAAGGNNSDLPHVNKKRLEAQGTLPREIKAPLWAVIEAWDIIQGSAQEIGAQAGPSNAEQ
ncbi:hypothetical protein QQ045_011267 [Rhodiola kirilowii]